MVLLSYQRASFTGQKFLDMIDAWANPDAWAGGVGMALCSNQCSSLAHNSLSHLLTG